MREDKTKMLQNSHSRWAGVSNVVWFLQICNSIALGLYGASFISLRASQWFKSQWKDRSYFRSFFKFHLQGLRHLLFENSELAWLFFILVKRYYAFLHLKPKLRGQFYFNKFENLFYVRTLDCLNVWHTSPIHVSCVHLLL